MKALIAAGGHATRLRPLTSTINKHLIPLVGKPMIFHAIEKIVDAGIREIFINVNPGERELQRAVGDGSAWGAKIVYIEQSGGPKGLAHIVQNAEALLGQEPFLFYLGDNIILGSIRDFVADFEARKLDCMLALSRVSDPERFGVPEIVDGRIVRVVEKPSNPPSPYAVTGIYVYSPKVFEAARAIKPSARGEYEISDAHTWLIENGGAVGYKEITGWWKDTGKPKDLLEANQLLLDVMPAAEAKLEGTIDPTATLQGKVRVGKGSVIGPGSLIRGPVVIGEDCVIERSCIGPYTSIGNRVTVRDTELEHSVVLDDAMIDCGRRVVDSLIGAHAQVLSVTSSVPHGHKMIVGDNSVVEI